MVIWHFSRRISQRKRIRRSILLEGRAHSMGLNQVLETLCRNLGRIDALIY